MFESRMKCRCVNHGSVDLPRASQFYLTESKPQFAPDRLVDIEHICLDIEVDLPSKTLAGRCFTTFLVIAPKVSSLKFDAIDLRVKKVSFEQGDAIQFDQNDAHIAVFFEKELKAGDRCTVVFDYSVVEPRAGLYFIAPDAHYPNRPWQLWTQGQDQDNRYWIPCHDSPNEKATTEMRVRVAENFTAISNGKCVGIEIDKTKKQKIFHYRQAVPHSSYLITLCVGEFVEMKDLWKNSKGEEIPVLYYTLAGREEETKTAFGKTPKMLDFFSKKTGVDYPYEKYAQVVAWDFIYGGMENTSATTQTEYTLHPMSMELDHSSEPLVAHELAHQWFGDLLTCREWSHAWLNEGFATYFESLWTEHEHGRDEFLYELFLNEKIYKGEDGGAYRRPIVTNVFMSPSDIFDRHLYEKGGRVLHMLRNLVGDDVWWQAIHHYLKKNHSNTVETVDLQRSFEAVSGRSLSWFFEQWVMKGGHPELKGSVEWDADKKRLKISLVQKQKESELVALFRMNVEVKVVEAKGAERFVVLEMNGKEASTFVACDEKPKFVSVNCGNTILGDWEVSADRAMHVAQLVSDGDVMGRIFAAKALSKDHSRESVEALVSALSREKFWGAQCEILNALKTIGSDRAVAAIESAGLKLSHPKARKTAVKALGELRRTEFAARLKTILEKDESPLAQYEAGIALGRMRTQETFGILKSALGKRESWHDSYDRGIVRGLAEFRNEPSVLPILEKYSELGFSMFLRRESVDALAHFGAAAPEKVVARLCELCADANFFVRLYAIEALQRLGANEALPAIKRVADSVVDPRTKRSAVVAIKTIRDGKTSNEEVEKLKGDFDRLREEYRALLSRFEKIENR